MNAVNSNSGDRELDTLWRGQRDHEPSMEEILASIRTVIAEEQEPEEAADQAAGARPGWTRAAAGPQIVYSKNDPAPQRASLEATQGVEASAPEVEPLAMAEPAFESEPSPDAAPPPEADAPNVVWGQREPDWVEPAEFASPVEGEPLLSPETGQAVASAFEALSANLAARGAELAEQMAREMLRPLLKTWLDENLPGIVERLVRAEIERVARGMR